MTLTIVALVTLRLWVRNSDLCRVHSGEALTLLQIMFRAVRTRVVFGAVLGRGRGSGRVAGGMIGGERLLVLTLCGLMIGLATTRFTPCSCRSCCCCCADKSANDDFCWKVL